MPGCPPVTYVEIAIAGAFFLGGGFSERLRQNGAELALSRSDDDESNGKG